MPDELLELIASFASEQQHTEFIKGNYITGQCAHFSKEFENYCKVQNSRQSINDNKFLLAEAVSGFIGNTLNIINYGHHRPITSIKIDFPQENNIFLISTISDDKKQIKWELKIPTSNLFNTVIESYKINYKKSQHYNDNRMDNVRITVREDKSKRRKTRYSEKILLIKKKLFYIKEEESEINENFFLSSQKKRKYTTDKKRQTLLGKGYTILKKLGTDKFITGHEDGTITIWRKINKEWFKNIVRGDIDQYIIKKCHTKIVYKNVFKYFLKTLFVGSVITVFSYLSYVFQKSLRV